MSIDRFGVPDNMLGPHAEEFYGALGRIVALSALLENRILAIYQALTNARQGEHTRLDLSVLIERSRKELGRLGGTPERKALDLYLVEAGSVAKKRNDYVHNLWPAQPVGRLFGWRPQRGKDVDGPYMITETTMDVVLQDLASLAGLLQRWNQIYGLVSAPPSTREDVK